MVADPPLHIVVLPLITALGMALTVMVAIPEIVPEHLESFTAVNV